MARHGVYAVSEIIDALEHDQPAHAVLREHIAIETRERAWPSHIVQDPVAADAFVQHTDTGRFLIRCEAAGQIVGPTGIAIVRGVRAVGDRIAKGDHSACRVRRLHVNAIDEIPVVNMRRRRKVRGGHCVSRLHVGRGIRFGVHGRAIWSRGDVNRDHEVGERSQCKIERVGIHRRSRRNGHVWLAGESQSLVAIRPNRARSRGHSHVRRRDLERRGAELI